MRIYLDNCCLNRPFDDLSQERVYFEAEAILTIIAKCEKDEWILLASSIIDYELSKLTNINKLSRIRKLYSCSKEWAEQTVDTEKRAIYFQEKGLKPIDSMHLAVAEGAKADVFLTTDDRLLNSAKKSDELKVKVSNPVSWLMEVLSNDK